MTDLETKPLVTDKDLADWVVHTCMLFGAPIDTSYKIAGLFVEAVNDALERK